MSTTATATERTYPFALFKGQVIHYAHNPKEEKALRDDGWADEQVFRPYPKALFAKDGTTVAVENQEEETAKLAQGYSLNVILPKEQPLRPEDALRPLKRLFTVEELAVLEQGWRDIYACFDRLEETVEKIQERSK